MHANISTTNECDTVILTIWALIMIVMMLFYPIWTIIIFVSLVQIWTLKMIIILNSNYGTITNTNWNFDNVIQILKPTCTLIIIVIMLF
jgi:hypothetical protein